MALDGGGLSAGHWDGRPCVLLSASWPAERIESVARAHQEIDDPHIAAVLESDPEASPGWVAFDCSATVDLELLVDAALASDVKIDFPSAVAFSDGLLDTLEAAHAAHRHAGSLAWRNVLIAPSGNWWLFAVDGNPYLEGNAGAVGLSMAPEVALGAPPTTAADAYAHFALVRSLLPCVSLYEGYERAIRGQTGGQLIEALQHLASVVLASPVGTRIDDIPALRDRYRTLRSLDPAMPSGDEHALRAAFAELAARARGPEEVPHGSTSEPIELRAVGRQLQRGERWIDLRERRVLWRVWSALLRGRETGESLTVDRLLSEAWPGERVRYEAGRARVYVAMSTLRKLGLEDVIVRDDDGYRLSACVRVELDPSQGS